ncbi:MAG: hypothetical protein AVDCRST_MAG88-3869 [uncultured Thermomicrobiales bacterium]|uniref:Uncharacterized protein n=1 Tax=uncultured Thermomicrobiales bacterium TaxID=1645740 RepID=A0A6J4VPP4_9BACT|nr:MAG: hypothetical protein AVDCRST_MAG88-3869 [uncultured Thermomicrobiales bacterium]
MLHAMCRTGSVPRHRSTCGSDAARRQPGRDSQAHWPEL